jgi:hypothetical protein
LGCYPSQSRTKSKTGKYFIKRGWDFTVLTSKPKEKKVYPDVYYVEEAEVYLKLAEQKE